MMAVNIRGCVFLGMKYVLPRMREGGSVVNMSSALGLVGGAGICAYVASKHAIIGLTKTLPRWSKERVESGSMPAVLAPSLDA